jgi:hypothetical protein
MSDASTSWQNLVEEMVRELETGLPANVKTVAFWKLTNNTHTPLDVNLLQEDLEIMLVRNSRFNVVNQRAMEGISTGLGQNLAGNSFQNLSGSGRSIPRIDAIIYGEVVDAGGNYADIDNRDYFTTVILKAVDPVNYTIIWARKITGYNQDNIRQTIGVLPHETTSSAAEGFALKLAEFLQNSPTIRQKRIRRMIIGDLENASKKRLNMQLLKQELMLTIVNRTRFSLVDPISPDFVQQDSRFRNIKKTDQLQADAIVYGRIRQVSSGQITAIIRINQLSTNLDIAAEIIQGHSQNAEMQLVNLLRNANPSHINSHPAGAEVFLDGNSIGHTPLDYRLGNGHRELTFKYPFYHDTTLTLDIAFGQAQELDIHLSPIPVFLNLASTPPGAKVTIDGNTVLQSTPLKNYSTTRGAHLLILEHPEHQTWKDSVYFDQDIVTLNITLRPPAGTLLVRSGIIDSAQVYLNRVPQKKKTPALIPDLPPGEYEVQTTKGRYLSQPRTVRIFNNRVTEVDVPINFSLKQKTPLGAALRSTVLPGLAIL